MEPIKKDETDWSALIKGLRENLVITNKEIALMVGVHEASVSYWESGRSRPNVHNMRRLLRLHNCKGLDQNSEALAEILAQVLILIGQAKQDICRVETIMGEIEQLSLKVTKDADGQIEIPA